MTPGKQADASLVSPENPVWHRRRAMRAVAGPRPAPVVGTIGRTPNCARFLAVSLLADIRSAMAIANMTTVAGGTPAPRRAWGRRAGLSVVACLVLIFDGLAADTLASATTTRHTEAASRPAATISVPVYITAGPDGALWFTDLGTKNDHGSVGRITTDGKVRLYTGSGIDGPGGITVGARPRPLVHQFRRRLDRADHDEREGHQLHHHRRRQPGRDHERP